MSVLRGLWNKSLCPIGLDVGARVVRMLQLDRRGEGWAVRAAMARPLPELRDDDGAGRAAALTEAVREMLRNGGFAGRRVVSCLPVAAVQAKNLRVPRMPAEELRAAVEWEAADRLSLSPETMQVEFLDAGEVRQGEELRQEIIVMAAPRQAIQEHLDALLACGLEPVAIDVAPAALARCLAGGDADSTEAPARVTLDVGYSSSKLVITRQGRVAFFKMIDIGGKQLDQAVAQQLGLAPPEAAELRRSLQSSAATTGGGSEQASVAQREEAARAVQEALREPVSELAKELGLCLRYFTVTFRQRRPDALLLAGGEAYEAHLAPVLAEGAGIEVQPARPLEGMDLTRVPELADNGRPLSEWAVAAGLSIRPTAAITARGAAA